MKANIDRGHIVINVGPCPLKNMGNIRADIIVVALTDEASTWGQPAGRYCRLC